MTYDVGESMNQSKKILVALDDSDASMRAVNYMADVIGGNANYHVSLLHVLDPLPPKLREFRGSENPQKEEALEEELSQRTEQWIAQSEHQWLPTLEKARSILKRAGLPANAIETEFWESVHHEDLVDDILEAGRKDGCGTIVVGRESFSWPREMFHHHVADELVRKAHGLTVWVVE
jgi:nucleotide-binding universal stress UspA family protein